MAITDLTQVRASAVPAVPKEITATQRLAALELAQRCEDLYSGMHEHTLQRCYLRDAVELLREIAR